MGFQRRCRSFFFSGRTTGGRFGDPVSETRPCLFGPAAPLAHLRERGHQPITTRLFGAIAIEL